MINCIEFLKKLFKKEKVLSIKEVKKNIGSNSRITAMRKLKSLNCINSYSNAGGYYTLPNIPKYDKNGIWTFENIHFSIEGTLINTISILVKNSHDGYFSSELDSLLHVKCGNALTKLFNNHVLTRKQFNNTYIYLWPSCSEKQLAKKMLKYQQKNLPPGYEKEELHNYLKVFLSVLNEKQRRIFLGFESLKYGPGGDNIVAEISGINRKTIGKGRRELINQNIDMERIRKEGGGRKGIKKKKF